MRTGFILLSVLVLLVACAPKMIERSIDGTEGCALVPDSEFEELLSPVFDQECAKTCAELSFVEWKCNEQDLLTCICQ